MGMMVFVIVAVVLAVLAHLFVRRFVLATLLSAVGAAFVFQLIVWIQLGHPDPLAPIAFAMTSVFGVVISALVGALVSVTRTKPQQ